MAFVSFQWLSLPFSLPHSLQLSLCLPQKGHAFLWSLWFISFPYRGVREAGLTGQEDHTAATERRGKSSGPVEKGGEMHGGTGWLAGWARHMAVGRKGKTGRTSWARRRGTWRGFWARRHMVVARHGEGGEREQSGWAIGILV